LILAKLAVGPLFSAHMTRVLTFLAELEFAAIVIVLGFCGVVALLFLNVFHRFTKKIKQ